MTAPLHDQTVRRKPEPNRVAQIGAGPETEAAWLVVGRRVAAAAITENDADAGRRSAHRLLTQIAHTVLDKDQVARLREARTEAEIQAVLSAQ